MAFTALSSTSKMCKTHLNLLLLLLLVALQLPQHVTAATAESKSHNISWGARGPRDIHLHRQIVSEKAKMLRIVSDDYEFRQTPIRFPYPRTITNIVVTDQYTDGDGGYATLKNGGPSTDFAVIHLKSQRGHGYNFIIDIYGQ